MMAVPNGTIRIFLHHRRPEDRTEDSYRALAVKLSGCSMIFIDDELDKSHVSMPCIVKSYNML